MAATDLLYLVVALLLGFALGVLALLLFRRRPPEVPLPPSRPPHAQPAQRPQPAARPPPPAAQGQPPRAPPAQPARQPPQRATSSEGWDEVEFSVVEDEPARPAPRAPPARVPPRPAAPPPPTQRPHVPEMDYETSVPTEWASRHVGPLEPGRVKGICSGCGTPISISKRRPIRVACPVCGRTRLLS